MWKADCLVAEVSSSLTDRADGSIRLETPSPIVSLDMLTSSSALARSLRRTGMGLRTSWLSIISSSIMCAAIFGGQNGMGTGTRAG